MTLEEYAIDRIRKLEAEVDDLTAQLKSERRERETVSETLQELKDELCGMIEEIGDATLYQGEWTQCITLYKRDFRKSKTPLIYELLKVRYEDIKEISEHMDEDLREEEE